MVTRSSSIEHARCNCYISIVWRCCPFARWKGLVTTCNREMQWGGVMHVGMPAPTCWRSWLFYLCHACDRGLEQQEELHASPTEWKSSEFRLFAVCLLFCVVIMVIKERKARLQEFQQNHKLGYYSVTRPFPSLQKGQQRQTNISNH